MTPVIVFLVLSLQNAEQEALQSSDRLKAVNLDIETVIEQEGASFAALLPRLSLQGNYTYLSTLPSFNNMPFGAHHNYSIGPALNYTLWDTFSSLKSYQALGKLKEAREQDQAATQLQILTSVRAAYIRVQLAQEELRLVQGSLDLAQHQERDILSRFNAGAATKLDKVLSSKQVIGFKQQLKQKQAELAVASQDLMVLTGRPAGFEFQLDSLQSTLAQLNQLKATAPTDKQPQIKSLQLMAEYSEKQASAQTAKLFPMIQLFASTTLAYPNGPVLDQINQNTIGFTLSLPLYLGDPTWHLVSAKRREAAAFKHRTWQLKTDLNKEFSKAQAMLESLREQQELATQDVMQSEEAAKLYYHSYQAGKANLIDVQSAHNQALQSKVGAARINAQILNQLVLTLALSGEKPHESP